MSGALSDLRVVEMGQLLAGPFCGQLFADFGADVVKLEPPGVGDPMREWGREKPHGKSLWWPVVARGKRSVTCDLRTPDGQQLYDDWESIRLAVGEHVERWIRQARGEDQARTPATSPRHALGGAR